jgi:sialate O-acetylesterase
MKYPFFICLIAFMINSNAYSISLPSFFSDNMVLQQSSEVRIWGWGKPKEPIKIVVSWDTTTYNTIVDNNANWEIFVKTPRFDYKKHEISILGYDTIKITNILFGEVWLCSGQSNMEWTAGMGIDNAEEEIKNADFSNIRFFNVNHQTSSYPQNNFIGAWSKCTPQTMINFSALAYFFAQHIHLQMNNVPIGLINSSWGGTPIETWMPELKITQNEYLSAGAAMIEEMEWGPNLPGRIYNSMIHPIAGYTIAGAIWYQGESNTGNHQYYTDMMTTLITSWREVWNINFPFYYVQIAPYMYEDIYQGAYLRNAQLKALKVPKTAMVVVSDICDTSEIHPSNKQDVGIRLGNIALVELYKVQNMLVHSPIYKNHIVNNNKILVNFDYATGLYSTDKEIKGFEIAGEDKKYYPASAILKDTSVMVSSSLVKNPKYVRYAFRSTSLSTLFNSAHLPMSSFITD